MGARGKTRTSNHAERVNAWAAVDTPEAAQAPEPMPACGLCVNGLRENAQGEWYRCECRAAAAPGG